METVLFIPGLPAPYPEDQYRLESRDIVWGISQFGGRQLAGTVLNRSIKNLDWVRVEFILYNKLNLPVGSTSDSLISFGFQQTWAFKAPVMQADAIRASEPLLSCEYGRVVQPRLVTNTPILARSNA